MTLPSAIHILKLVRRTFYYSYIILQLLDFFSEVINTKESTDKFLHRKEYSHMSYKGVSLLYAYFLIVICDTHKDSLGT